MNSDHIPNYKVNIVANPWAKDNGAMAAFAATKLHSFIIILQQKILQK